MWTKIILNPNRSWNVGEDTFRYLARCSQFYEPICFFWGGVAAWLGQPWTVCWIKIETTSRKGRDSDRTPDQEERHGVDISWATSVLSMPRAFTYFGAQDCGAVAGNIFASFVVEAFCFVPCASFTRTLGVWASWAVAAVGKFTLTVPHFRGCTWEVGGTTVILIRRRLQLIQWGRLSHSLNAVSW